jgi:hypothetical protein
LLLACGVAAWVTGSGIPAHAQTTNLALHKPADQISRSPWSTGKTTADDAAGAVDGIKNGYFGFHTNYEPNPWWQVDLQQISSLSEIRVYNRLDEAGRAATIQVLLSNDKTNWQTVYRHNGTTFGGTDGRPLAVNLNGAQARYVRLQLAATNYLHLDEVEVYGTPGGSTQNPATTATLRTQKSNYAPNETIVVEYAGLPGNQSDWISIAKTGAPENQYESGRWAYTNGERSGSRAFQGLPAGSYEARVYFNWPDGGFTIRARYAFTVGEATASAGNFAGVWETDLGFYIGLVQSGANVQGYIWIDGDWYPLLTGTVTGNVLKGTWDLQVANGTFQFTLGVDASGKKIFQAQATGLFGWVEIEFTGYFYSS